MNSDRVSLIISAPSGTGKTTIIKKLISASDLYSFAVSTTTRYMRAGEEHGKNYYFTDVRTFNKMIRKSDFIEWAIVHGNFYGIQKKEMERILCEGRIPIFDIDIQGAVRLKEILRNGIFIFICPPSIVELEKRLRLRYTDTEEQIRIRLENAIEEMEAKELFDFILINENVDNVLKEINDIVASKLKT